MRFANAATALAAFAFAGSATAATLIHAGRLIDGQSDAPRERVTVVVDGDRIRSIEAGFVAPAAGDVVIDLSNADRNAGPLRHARAPDGRAEPAQRARQCQEGRGGSRLRFGAIRGAHAAGGLYLACAISAISSTSRSRSGGRSKNAKSKGPRVFTSGRSIGTRGGHADATNSFGPFLTSDDPRLDTVCSGADDCREAVRQRYQDGADSIKIMATGGVLSIAKSGTAPQFTDEELEAIITTAHDYSMKVAAHAHGTEGMKRAVRAGIDSIEHGTYMDDETLKMMKDKGTHYVPTISAGRWVFDQAQDPTYFPALVRPKALAIGPLIQQTFAKAWKGGLTIMFGTDCGVCPHGSNAKEFGYMVGGWHAGDGGDPFRDNHPCEVSRRRRSPRQRRSRQARGHHRGAGRPARRRSCP